MIRKIFLIVVIFILSVMVLSCGDDNEQDIEETNNQTEITVDNNKEVGDRTLSGNEIKEIEKSNAGKKAKALVKKGISHIKKVGKETAFEDFNNREAAFVDGEFYLFIVDFNGLTLSHGGNVSLVGKEMWDLRDPDGIYFIREFIKVAKEQESGWVVYKWSNPVSEKVEDKCSFVQAVEGENMFVGCGFYKK